ncbi:MAG: pantetheine-phosphate adenylyltransferase [Clostridia bacterium]|nr:pantetheine-phosphate adenylyltransferase [Clostridia bacterium]
MKKTGMVTGTFDPITIGHIDIIRRASLLFDKLFVVLLINPDKTALFSDGNRLQMMKLATKQLENVEVLNYEGWAIEIAKELGATYFVRGVRNENDFSYELEMRDWNISHGGIDTLFIPCDESLRQVSSTKAKERIVSGDYSLLPNEIKEFVKTIFEVNNGQY